MFRKKIHITLVLVISLFFVLKGEAQVQLEREVIGSRASFDTTVSLMISSTVGEPMVTTAFTNNFIFTQGFHQTKQFAANDSMYAMISVTNSSCPGAVDGMIEINSVNGCSPPYTGTLDSTGETGMTFDSLVSGSYIVSISSINGCILYDTLTVGSQTDVPCDVGVFNAFSPDEDGVNDLWIIDNIEQYPDNRVVIFNRWGDLVNEFNGYDNREKVWKGRNRNGTDLPAGTYFYVIEPGDGSSVKGWVQITR